MAFFGSVYFLLQKGGKKKTQHSNRQGHCCCGFRDRQGNAENRYRISCGRGGAGHLSRPIAP